MRSTQVSTWALVVASTLLVLSAGGLRAQDLGGWVAPEGGWDYVYEANEDEDVDGEFDFDFADGGSLDGTWTHNNGSDAWDGSGPGDEFRPDGVTPAAPGGAGTVIVPGAGEDGGDAEVLSVVDIGDPRPLGFSDPSNRKTWFCHDTLLNDGVDATNALRDGITLIVRSRLHPDIDDDAPGHQLPDGGIDDDAGQGVAPGYTIRDGGKGGHGFYDAGLDRNFTFVPWGTEGYQFPPQVGEGLPPANFLNVGNNSVFHSFWVTIEDEDANDRYTVTVYIDGAIEPAEIFEDIQVGDDTDCDGISHLHMGFHSTPQKGGMQVDYFGYKLGVHEPTSFCPGGLIAAFDDDNGQVSLSWSPGAVDSYTLKENGQEIATGIAAGTTSFTVMNPARPTAKYELVSVGRECNVLSATVTTVVCPQLSCSADAAAGEVTLSWDSPAFFEATGFAILRDGVEVGSVAGDARSFTDRPSPGEYTYELAVTSNPAEACPSNAFCTARLFAPGSINISGEVWDQVVFNGQVQKVTTTDGVASAYFPAAPKTEGDVAAFAVDVTALGDGEIEGDRYRVEIRARYDNEIRVANRTLDPASFVHFDLARTGVSTATDELGNQEVVEQVPSPPGGPTVDSVSSTIVNTDTAVGLELVEGINLIEIQPVDSGGFPHNDQVQIFELRIGPFAEGFEASIVPFPCPTGLTCARNLDGAIELSWSSGDPHAYEIQRDGETIAEIPMGDTLSYTDEPGDGFFQYTVIVTDDDTCPPLSCSAGGGIPDIDGFIREWLILGPLDWGCTTQGIRRCDSPGARDIEKDHLAGTVDGEAVNEAEILPVPGMEVTLSSSTVKPTVRDDINPGAPGAAAWFAYTSSGSAVDLNVAFGGSPGNDYMAYAVTYVENTNDEPLDANIEVASDDSVQVLVNEDSVHTNNVARGVDLANLDFVAGVTLAPGVNRIMVKVYQGGGGVGLALRFVDDLGVPLLGEDGLRICLTPDCTSGGETGGLQVPGDCNGDGAINISDAVCLLGFLFQGNPTELPCGDGSQAHPANIALMDANGDGAINLSDAISELNFLFGGGSPHPLAIPGEETTGCVRIEGCPDACQ